MTDARICFTAPQVVELLDNGPTPDAPEGGILIRNGATLVSPGTELACLAGREAWFALPGIPGYCAVGTIAASRAPGWRAGEMVVHHGAHRAWQVAVPGVDFLCRVPAGIAPAHAVFARLATIAMTALRNSAIELGDEVGVTGLGLVGNLAAQCAALQGARVIGFDIDADRVALARACGLADAVHGGPAAAQETARGMLGGRGFSTLIEASGRAGTLLEALPLLARGGEVLLLGTPRAACPFDLAEVLRSFHLSDRALVLKPAHEWIRPVEEHPFVKHSFARDTRVALDLIASGRLRVAPLVTHVVAPWEAPGAYAGLAAGAPGYAGIVIDWRAWDRPGSSAPRGELASASDP